MSIKQSVKSFEPTETVKYMHMFGAQTRMIHLPIEDILSLIVRKFIIYKFILFFTIL